MYKENNYKFGFFVVRDSWTTVKAKITGIENVTEGAKIKGRHPYYGNPKVKAEFYKNGTFQKVGFISCAGTFSYSKLDE